MGGSALFRDVYFSADVETDGPVPGPYSMLSFAIVVAGTFDGKVFHPRDDYGDFFRAELKPISENFQEEALRVNGIDRARLVREGPDASAVMTNAASWIRNHAAGATPVLVAYPVSFDWTWLYWYFTMFSKTGSPFNHSLCFDIKTAYAVKSRSLISHAGRRDLPPSLLSTSKHTHDPLDDAIEQAQIFTRLFNWSGR
jgi:DNA polymerase III epsilon subunit-like protein